MILVSCIINTLYTTVALLKTDLAMVIADETFQSSFSLSCNVQMTYFVITYYNSLLREMVIAVQKFKNKERKAKVVKLFCDFHVCREISTSACDMVKIQTNVTSVGRVTLVNTLYTPCLQHHWSLENSFCFVMIR